MSVASATFWRSSPSQSAPARLARTSASVSVGEYTTLAITWSVCGAAHGTASTVLIGVLVPAAGGSWPVL